MEIPACGGLILGDIPKDGKELLMNKMIEVNEKMSDEEIINILENTIINYEKYYDKIIDKEYNLDKYIEKINEIINKN